MKEINATTLNLLLRKLLSYATSEEKIDQEYDKYIHLFNRKLYVFDQERTLLGCIGIEFITQDHYEIKHIAVTPSERGNGLGSKMIRDVCNKHSIRLLTAETDHDAVDFYRKYGFEVTSLGEKYPKVERFLCEYRLPS